MAPRPVEPAVGRIEDLVARYRSALARLTDDDRDAILSRVELGQPWEQVASALGASTTEECKTSVRAAIARLIGAPHEAPAGSRVGELVRAVAEGEPVAWDAELARAAAPEERAWIEQLRVVARIGGLNEPGTATSTTESAAARAPAEPGPALAPGGVLGRRFRIVRLLGRGGMGEVWQAFDLKLRIDVALKSVRRELLQNERAAERLRGEVRSAHDVVSANVCRIFDLVELEGLELVSMEYVDGRTLIELLRERGPLAPREAMELASQFLAGLEAIHQAGLVHRDIKPENLMITRSGRVVIMDFGLARPQVDDRTLSIAGTPAYMAPEQVLGAGVDARTDIFAAGVVLAEMLGSSGTREAREAIQRGVRDEPPRLPESAWRPVLLRAVAERREDRWASVRELLRALEQVALRVEGAEEARPYPGLSSFTQEDAEYFFGRELEVEALWRKLGQANLLAVIGPSGSGKSSFLRAGLLPAMPAGWAALIATPGARPFAALAHALADEFRGGAEAAHELLRFDEPEVALRLMRRWRERHGGALLIVDQFEELFTLNGDDVQTRFTNLLGQIALEADVHVLLAMRDDFLFRCQSHPALAPVFAELTPLGPPTGTALRRAIVQPAFLCGYRFEDEDLAAELLDAVAHERGALPLLAFTAARLWEERDRAAGQLTRETYRRIGGVEGALARHAEAVIERVGEERLPIVREVFRNLVTAQGTRAAREYDELLSVFGEPVRGDAEAVLRVLIDARLLTEYEDRSGEREEERVRRRIEIIHESLLEAWPRLVRWRAQDAEGAVLRDQLRQAAQLWKEKGGTADLLWTGTAYQEFELWRERYAGKLTAVESEFARAMADKARRRKRLVRTGVSAAFVILAGFAIAIAISRQQVKGEALRAEAGKLLALGRLELDRDPTAALAYARMSLELSDTREARRFALEVLWRGPVARIFSPAEAGVASDPKETSAWSVPPAFSPDSSWLVLTNGTTGRTVLLPSDGGPTRILDQAGIPAFGPKSELIVSGAGANFRVLALPDLQEIGSIDVGQGLITVRGSDKGLIVLTDRKTPDGARRWEFRSWPLPRGEPKLLATIDPSMPGGGTWEFSGTWLASYRVKDKSIYVRPLADSGPSDDRLVGTLNDHLLGDWYWRFFPKGNGIFAVDRSNEIRLWPLVEGVPGSARVLRGPPNGGWITSIDSDATRFARAGPTGVHLWDLRDPPDTEPVILKRGETGGRAIGAFDPGGRWLIDNNSLHQWFWPVAQPRRRQLATGGSGAFRLEFTADGRWLVSCDKGGPTKQWPLDAADGTARNLTSQSRCWSIATDPASRRLLLGTWLGFGLTPDGRAGILSLADEPPRILPTGWEGQLGTCEVRFHPLRDQALACPCLPASRAGLADPTRRVLKGWDLESGRERIYSLANLTDESWIGCEGMRFLPDGGVLVGGIGGVLRLALPDDPNGTVSGDRVYAAPRARFALSADGRRVLLLATRDPNPGTFEELVLLDLAAKTSRRITTHGNRLTVAAFDPSGQIIVTGDADGIVRAGPATGEEPQLLVGHSKEMRALAVSPDGRWIASSTDDAVYLWPMPDVTRQPLHTLPHAELMARLDSLTNLRVVRDAAASTGWKLEIGPFPGWKDVPSW